MKVVVMHRGYGCDTGCCGHVVEWEDGTSVGGFYFDHPDKDDDLEWAKEIVEGELGAEHVADLDWENCLVREW